MRVLIIGLGEVGRQLVQEFEVAGHEVVAIDAAPEAAQAMKDLDIDVRVGSGANETLLDELEVGSLDLVVAVSNNDEVNLVAGHIAKRKGARKVVARAQGVDYTGSGEGIRTDFLWLDLTINPSVLVAQELVNFARSHGAVEVLDLVRGQIDLVQVEVTDDSRYIDKPISSIPIRDKETLVAAIVRNDKLYVPGGTDTLLAGDRLYLVGKRSGLRKAEDLFTSRREAKRTCIAGGGLTAEIMAQELTKDSSTLIIESNPNRAKELKASLPNTVDVIVGDATDLQTLEEQELQRFDLFVAVTANDEVNMMAALLAKRLGVPRTAALVNRPQSIDVLRSLGIDMPVSARSTASRVILRETMRKQGQRISLLDNERAEVLEYFVTGGDRVHGRSVGELDLPRGSLACAILREGEEENAEGDAVVIPGGSTRLQEGDRVIMLVTPGSRLDVASNFREVRT